MTIKKKVRARKITIDLTGPEGNAFCVLGIITRLMKTLGYSKPQIDAVMQQLTSGDYEHLIATADKHFGEYIDFLR